MRIASWNVNSINTRLPNVLRWLEANQPDVVLLQELKCMDEKFPAAELKAAGYDSAVHGQKSYNGVAILSKHPVENIAPRLKGDDADEQSRYIEATVKGVRVASIYLPNGNPVGTEKYPYKLSFFDRLINHARDLLATGQPVVLGGDYNVIPAAEDCYDPAAWAEDALFLLDSRKKLRAILNLGYTDAFRAVNDQPHQYTFWDYQAGCWPQNKGIRIDHFLLSPKATDRLQNCVIDAGPRGEDKASDHTPIIVTLKS